MSADNWTQCPRCLADATAKAAADAAAVAALYGTIPAEEFDAKRSSLTGPDEVYMTFREDYEFYGADEGEVCWAYSGSCTICDLAVSLKGSRRFYGEAI